MKKVVSLFIVLVLLGCASAPPKTQEETLIRLAYSTMSTMRMFPECFKNPQCMALMPPNEFSNKKGSLRSYESKLDQYDRKIPERVRRHEERKARFYAMLDTVYCKAHKGKIMSKEYISCLPARELNEFPLEETAVCVVDGEVLFVSRNPIDGVGLTYSNKSVVDRYYDWNAYLLKPVELLNSRPVYSSVFLMEKVVSSEGTQYRVKTKVTKLPDSYLVTRLNYSRGEIPSKEIERVTLCEPFWRTEYAAYDDSILLLQNGNNFVGMDDISLFFGLSLSEAVVMNKISTMKNFYNPEREYSTWSDKFNDLNLTAEDFVSLYQPLVEGKLNWPNVLAGKTVSLQGGDIHVNGTLTAEQLEILRMVSVSFPYEVKGSGPWHMKAVFSINPADGRVIIKSLSLQ